jgi:hypothetical protein
MEILILIVFEGILIIFFAGYGWMLEHKER